MAKTTIKKKKAKATKATKEDSPIKEKELELTEVDFMRLEMEQLQNGITIKGSLTDEITYGLDIDQKVIYLSGEIDQHSGNIFHQKMVAILKFHGYDHEDPITVNVSSYGGDVYSMLSIIDSIQNCPCKVDTIGRGQIMSAAALILASGTGKRYMTENSWVMNHEISTMLAGQSSNIINESAHIQQLQDIFCNLLDKFTKRRKGFWSRKLRHNLYLTAEEAKKLKLIDKIIGT